MSVILFLGGGHYLREGEECGFWNKSWLKFCDPPHENSMQICDHTHPTVQCVILSPSPSTFKLRGRLFSRGQICTWNVPTILQPLSQCGVQFRAHPLNVAANFARKKPCILWLHSYDRLAMYTHIVVNTAITSRTNYLLDNNGST